MPSEVVMYQSMFVLGILMFGVFSVTFNNYSDLAEDVTIEGNLQRVVQEVGQEIISLIRESRQNQISGGNIDVTISLSLQSDYAGEAYQIVVRSNSLGQAELVAQIGTNNEDIASFSLGYLMGTNPVAGEINFAGILSSGDPSPTVSYEWSDSPILFENVILD